MRRQQKFVFSQGWRLESRRSTCPSGGFHTEDSSRVLWVVAFPLGAHMSSSLHLERESSLSLFLSSHQPHRIKATGKASLTGHPWRMLENEAMLLTTVTERIMRLLKLPSLCKLYHKLKQLQTRKTSLLQKYSIQPMKTESWVLNIIILDLEALLAINIKEERQPQVMCSWPPPSGKPSCQKYLS